MATRQRKDLERNRKVKEAERGRKEAADAAVTEAEHGADAEQGETKPVTDAADAKRGDSAGDNGNGEAKRRHGLSHRPGDDGGKDAGDNGKRSPRHMRAGAKETDGRKPKKKQHKAVKIVVAVIAVAAMVLASGAGIYGLFVGAEDAANQNWDKTGKIAATVMGDNIMEDTITSQIMSARGDKSDADWAQYLVDNDETPSGLRSQAISSYQSDIILRHAMLDNGLSYTLQQSDVDRWWDAEGSTYEQYGINEDTAKSYYASSIRQWLLEQAVTPEDSITDQDVIDYLNEHADTYNGARKSSHILFALDSDGTTDNKEKAESVLQQIKDGEITFEDAVSQYSTDSTSAADNGNVGWDCDSSFVEAYETALKGLNKGDITDTVVESTYGYHIIECTDVLEWDGTLDDISIVPQDIVDNVRKTLQSEKFQEWYSEYQSNADITINDMPHGLPYDVSLDGVTKSENANSNGSSSVSVVSTDENGNVVTSDGSDSGVTVSGSTTIGTSDTETATSGNGTENSASSDSTDATSADGTSGDSGASDTSGSME